MNTCTSPNALAAGAPWRTSLSSATTASRELRADLDKAEKLVWEMREHVEHAGTLIDLWIEAFNMVQEADGTWELSTAFVEGEEWFKKYAALVAQWNWFVPEWNAMVRPRNSGDRSPPATPRSPRC